MKLIPKYLQGGFAQFFSTYQPVFAESRKTPSSTKEEKKEDRSKSELTEKDLFLMLKDLDGLPNEVNALVRNFTNTLLMSSLLGVNTSDLSRQYMRSLGLLRVAKFNKELYDKAYKEAEKNGALNDIAITTAGLVIVLTEDGELSAITPLQLLSSNGEYTPVTNSNLLWLRAHDQSFINNNAIFLTIENGIGLELVHRMIKDRFSKLGSSKITSEKYFPKEAIKGNELLEEAISNGPDGYYKWKLSLTKTDENLIVAALDYIYDTLPNNAKTRLLLLTQTGTMGEIRDIITRMLISGIDTSVENTFTHLKDSSSKDGTGSSENSDLSKIPDTTAQQWLAGLGTEKQFVINPKSTNGYAVRGNVMPLTDHSGNPLPVLSSTLIDVSQGEFGTILDFNSVSIGGRLISSANLGGVALRDNDIISIDLPCELNESGEIVPLVDPATIRKINKVRSDLAAKGINLNNKDSIKQHYDEVSQAFSAENLVTPYTSEGETILNWHRFGVIKVFLDDRIVGHEVLDNFEGVKRITDEAVIDNLISAFDDKEFKKGRRKPFWLRDRDHMYEGLAYIPVVENALGALSTTNLNWGQSKIVNDMLLRLAILQEHKNNVQNGPVPQQQ